MTEKNNNTKIILPELQKIIDQVMSYGKSSTSESGGHTLIGNRSKREALTSVKFRGGNPPIKLIEEDYITTHSATHPADKLFDKKPMPKPHVAFAYDEANKLRRDNPNVNQVMARTRINILLEREGYKPYSRTQFNRITEDLNFPPAPGGRKSAKHKK